MKPLLTAVLVLSAAAAAAAPKASPPPAPPRGKAKLRDAKPTPPGTVLKLKPGQTRLTAAQLKLVMRKAPPPSPKKSTAARGKKTGR